MGKKQDFQFLSADGKTQIHAVKWMPENEEYKAILQITHGMQEYIERYGEFAEFLNQRGYLVVGHDHLGHGKSILSKGDLGYFTDDHPSDTLVEDIHQLRLQIQKEHHGIPYFMLGHSMGSYLLRKYVSLHGENLWGAVFVGTGCMPDKSMKLGMFICRTLARIKGWHYKSDFMKSLSFMGAYKKYDITGLQIERNWLTKDLEIAEKYYRDPKCAYSFTVNGYFGLMETVFYDNQSENIAKIPKELPIFLISGADDPVGNMGIGVKEVYYQYVDAKISDVTWKLYENDRHELLNEVDRKDVYEEICAWMYVREKTSEVIS